MFDGLSSGPWRKGSLAAAALLTVVGLYLSLRLVLNQAFLDPDSSHSLVLWQGLRENGLSWLSTWRFTQDNWILSLFPLHFLGYSLFGAVPAVPLLGGWLIFAAAAGVSALLAWQCGARQGALWVMPVLLCAGLEAHLRGLLAYSTTHNSSNLFGLIALALILAWLRNGGPGKLLLAWFVLCAVALSDPWLLPAFNLPLLLLALTFLALPQLGVARSRGWTLLAVAVTSTVLTRTQLFGLIELPSIEYEMGAWDAFGSKLVLLLRELGALLHVIPLFANATGAIVSALLVGALALSLLAFGYRDRLLDNAPAAALALFTAFSTGGICAAFLLNDSSDASFELGARLLVNCLYLVVPLLAVLCERHWQALPKALCYATPVLALGFVLSGVTSSAVARQGNNWQFQHRQSARILDALQAQGLTYGYGSYWGAAANAVTALSQGEVVIRPISFDARSGRAYADWRPQSSRRWYSADDMPEGQREVFVLISTEDDGDDGGCLEMTLCTNALEQQFGPPARRVDLDPTRRVLVWQQPLRELWLTD